MTLDYANACREATINQGLQPFADADGWSVEQTGGFTMVATRILPDGTVWTVTRDGADETALLRSPLNARSVGTRP